MRPQIKHTDMEKFPNLSMISGDDACETRICFDVIRITNLAYRLHSPSVIINKELYLKANFYFCSLRGV